MAASTTLKTEQMKSRPLQELKLEDLPGIGNAMAKVLRAAGWTTATQVMGHYLIADADNKKFAAQVVELGVLPDLAMKLAIGLGEKYKLM